MQHRVHVAVLVAPGAASSGTTGGVHLLVAHALGGARPLGARAQIARQRLGQLVGAPLGHVALDGAVVLLDDRHVHRGRGEKHGVCDALVVLVDGLVALVVHEQDAAGLVPKMGLAQFGLDRAVVADHGQHQPLAGAHGAVRPAVEAGGLQLHAGVVEVRLGAGVGAVAEISLLDQRADAALEARQRIVGLVVQALGRDAQLQHLAERMPLQLLGVAEQRFLVREVD